MKLPESAINQFINGAEEVNDHDEEIVSSSLGTISDTQIDDDSSDENINSITDFLDDDEEDVALIGVNKDNIDTEVDENTSTYEEYNRILNEQMANMRRDNPDAFSTRSAELIDNITKYRKELMIKNGFTEAEADTAARNRLKNKAAQIESDYIEEHPDLVVINIDKTNSSDVSFTEEEKEKLIKTKKIKFVEVEESKLKTLKLKNIKDRKERINAIYRKSCNLSHNSVPCFNTVDFCTFNGATVNAILNAVHKRSKNENGSDSEEPLYSWIMRKAQFLYDHFLSSTTREKYDMDNNIILSFNDFLKWYKFYDMDVGIYSIYVASSTEMITSGFICNSEICKNPQTGDGRQFEATYNTKSIIKFDKASDENKEVLDNILGARGNIDKMKELQDKYMVMKRVESEFTHNCYDFSMPSIDDYLVTIRALEDTNCEEYVYDFVAWTRAIYVRENPDDPDSEYILIDDIDDIIEYYKNIVETEKFLINILINKYTYRPYYSVNTICPNCGNKSEVKMNIDDLVFQRFLSLEAAIEI